METGIKGLDKVNKSNIDNKSMGVYTEKGNEYDIPEGIVFSFPVTVDSEGEVNIVKGIQMPDTLSNEKIQITIKELQKEREAVEEFLI